jgi:hypothetical protein
MVTQQHPSTHGVDEDEQRITAEHLYNAECALHAAHSPTSTPGSPRPATAYTRRSANTSPPRLQADHDGQPPRATAVATVSPAAGVANQSHLLDIARLSGMLPATALSRD